MQMRYYILTASLLFGLFTTQSVLAGDESTTKSPVSPQSTTQNINVTTTTTPAPKVNISNSALCQKCFCDFSNRQLDCSNRKLKDWFSDDEWNTLQNGNFLFESVNLENNNLTMIPQLPFYPMSNLYLAFNEINNISIGAFQNLSELKKLDLSHNKLTSKVMVPDVFRGKYSPSDFAPLDKLTELNLGYNELHNLDSDLFEHLTKLEVLILCKNIFKVIDHLTEIAIAGLTSLKTLDMSYMELRELPENLLHGPRDLETLILTGNLLKQLPRNLELAVNLNSLVLDENLIENISGDNSFPAITNLKYLSISYMPELKRIDAGGLSNLQNLTTLIASNNPKLSYIDEAAFYKNTSNPRFHDYPPLTKLYLHNNNLTIFNRDLIYRVDKMVVIDLRYNPWICDASNDFLINILMPQITSLTPILAKNVECSSPPELKSLSLNEQRVRDATTANGSITTSVVLITLFVSLLIGIPIIIATVVLYRRGCFGILYRRATPAGAQYNRASSAEDLHI